MDNKRHASLVLNSSYLVRNVDTNNDKTLLTWNNINLRNLLGDMYEQFDFFNISLKFISMTSSTGIGSNSSAFSIHIRMSGLPWVNNSYTVKSGFNNQYCVIGAFRLLPNNIVNRLYDNNIFTFGKDSGTCNITIDFLKNADDKVPDMVNSGGFPSFLFMFDITGVPK
jgi:hypothetical protein